LRYLCRLTFLVLLATLGLPAGVQSKPLEIDVSTNTRVGWPATMAIAPFDYNLKVDKEGYSPKLPAEFESSTEGFYVREQTMSAIWDFGDGTPVVDRGNRMVASHVYRKAGDYRVSVTILDEDGTVFEQASKKINVKNMEPRLSYTAVAVNADKPAQLTFSAATHGQDIAMYDKPLNILWDFGDGNQRAGKDLFKVTHNYAKTGTYQTTKRARKKLKCWHKMMTQAPTTCWMMVTV